MSKRWHFTPPPPPPRVVVLIILLLSLPWVVQAQNIPPAPAFCGFLDIADNYASVCVTYDIDSRAIEWLFTEASDVKDITGEDGYVWPFPSNYWGNPAWFRGSEGSPEPSRQNALDLFQGIREPYYGHPRDNLSPNTEYEFHTRSAYTPTDGFGPHSVITFKTRYAPKPGNVRTLFIKGETADDPNILRITWNPVPDAAHYFISIADIVDGDEVDREFIQGCTEDSSFDQNTRCKQGRVQISTPTYDFTCQQLGTWHRAHLWAVSSVDATSTSATNFNIGLFCGVPPREPKRERDEDYEPPIKDPRSTAERIHEDTEGYSVAADNLGIVEARVVTADHEIGNQQVRDASPITALDLWSYWENGIEQGITVCLPGAGRMVLLDATYYPGEKERRPTLVSTWTSDGQTCARVVTEGTLVLMEDNEKAREVLRHAFPGNAAPLTEGEQRANVDTNPPGSEGLDNCMVRTTDDLNFRASPGGLLIDSKPDTAERNGIPYGVTLTALRRTGDWVLVDYHGVKGWISRTYSQEQGQCLVSQ